MKKLLCLIMAVALSSCTIYSSSFTCPDSKGARCVMLSEVDKRVDSGEIETVYLKGKCKGGVCQVPADIPKKRLDNIHYIKIEPINEAELYEDKDMIYLK